MAASLPWVPTSELIESAKVRGFWSRGRELNSRPADYESAALPLSYLGSFFDNSIRAKFLSIEPRNCVLLSRERIHRPADPHADQQEQKQGPDDVFYAVAGAAAAQKPKRDGDEQRKERHRLKMSEPEPDCGNHAFRPRAAS